MNKIKEMRLKAGVSQAYVAEKLGFDTSQMISNCERSISFFSPKTFKKVAKIYKVDVNEIIDIYVEREKWRLAKKINKLRNNLSK